MSIRKPAAGAGGVVRVQEASVDVRTGCHADRGRPDVVSVVVHAFDDQINRIGFEHGNAGFLSRGDNHAFSVQVDFQQARPGGVVTKESPSIGIVVAIRDGDQFDAVFIDG